MNKTIKQIRRLMIAVVGFTLLISGVVMFVLPAPGLLVVLLALAILGTEFLWARNLLHHVRKRFQKKNNGDQS
ncbi:MAG TPA: PGPGW domain-containing protein [Candidatus Kryptonia bacterium]